MGNFQSEVDDILANRRKVLEKVQKEGEKLEELRSVCNKIEDLLEEYPEQEFKGKFAEYGQYRKILDDLLEANKKTERRLSRKTVNIGVAGGARVGKSTLLQTLTGLTDDQIPSGSGAPVTAVRSQIFNQEAGAPSFARIEFYDETDFIENRIKPLMKNHAGFSAYLEKKGIKSDVFSMKEFLGFSFDSQCDGNDSDLEGKDEINIRLGKLLKIKKYYDSYKDSIGQGQKTVHDMSSLRQYVAYPKDEESEPHTYLAVRNVEIHCHFPSLDGVKIQLVDLPGFGEVGGVDEIQLQGLDSEIDHAIQLLCPDSDATSYLGQSFTKITGSLEKIQKEVKGEDRSNLFTCLVNQKAGCEGRCEGLKKELVESSSIFSQDIIFVTDVTDKAAADQMFHKVLERMTTALPKLDEAFRKTCVPKDRLNALRGMLQNLEECAATEKKAFPSATVIAIEAEFELRSSVLETLEAASKDWNGENRKEEFQEEVMKIFNELEEGVERMFFDKHGYAEWEDFALKKGKVNGNPTYVWADECHRIRMKLLDSYGKLNNWYRERLGQLKERVAKALREGLIIYKDSELQGEASFKEMLEDLQQADYSMKNLEDSLEWMLDLKLDFLQQVYPAIYDNCEIALLDPQKGAKAPDVSMEVAPHAMQQVIQDRARTINFNLKKEILANNFIDSYLNCALDHFRDMMLFSDIEKIKQDFVNFFEENKERIGLGGKDKARFEFVSKMHKLAKDAAGLVKELEA